jgi:spore maturation protein CgeB
MQSCLITDWKLNLPDMFEVDKEIVTYRTAAECAEKVRYLLEHEDQRRDIALAGQRRTLRDHTYGKRAEQLNEMLGQLLSDRDRATTYSIPISEMANQH